MANRTYRLTEIVGTSTESMEDAVRNGVARASETLRHLDWFEVTEVRGQIDGGEVRHWQVGHQDRIPARGLLSRRCTALHSSMASALGGLADRRHVEVGDPQRGHGDAREEVAPLPRQRDLGVAGTGDAGQQVDRALVEAEVVHRTDDLASFDQVDAVAGEPGEQQRLRIDLSDVPQGRQQQSPLGAARRASSSVPEPPSTSSARLSIIGVIGPPAMRARCAGSARARSRRPWSTHGGALQGQPVVEHRRLGAPRRARPRTVRTPCPGRPGR